VAEAQQIEHDDEAAVATLWRALAMGKGTPKDWRRDVGLAKSGTSTIPQLPNLASIAHGYGLPPFTSGVPEPSTPDFSAWGLTKKVSTTFEYSIDTLPARLIFVALAVSA
jgi:hypothetical protein